MSYFQNFDSYLNASNDSKSFAVHVYLVGEQLPLVSSPIPATVYNTVAAEIASFMDGELETFQLWDAKTSVVTHIPRRSVQRIAVKLSSS